MAQARGSQSVVALFEESTFATDPGTPNGVILYVTKNGMMAKQNQIRSNTIISNRERARPGRGNISVDGPIEMEISAENIGTILKHAMGSSSPTGAGPYTHTITLGSLPTGLVIEKDYGSNISGTGRYEKFNGCRISQANFKFPSEGHCTASFTMLGAKQTLGSAPLDATLTDNGHTPFTSFEGVMLEGGSSISTITDLEFTIDNELDNNVYAIGGAGQRRAAPEGFSTISGRLTALFEDATLLNKAINRTASSIKMTLTRGTGAGSAGNESIEFFIQNLDYERTSPGIEGPNGISINLNFMAYRVSSTSSLQVTLKNALATI